MKSRKMIIAVLLFVAVAVSSATFAFWASGVTGNDDTATGTVTIGEGDAVTTTVNVSNQTDGGALVPVGFEDGSGDVNNVDLTFPVTWESDTPSGADALTGTLDVSVDSVEVDDGSTTVDKSGLFTVTVTSGDGTSITEDSAENVVVNVEFTDEPADESEYNEVANNDLVVTLTFTVTPD